jgi:hypothetical protein
MTQDSNLVLDRKEREEKGNTICTSCGTPIFWQGKCKKCILDQCRRWLEEVPSEIQYPDGHGKDYKQAVDAYFRQNQDCSSRMGGTTALH